ncbi:hypothetical protein [Micromonospora wenchangensis]|uniref:hypothetical protein n=1 Tax=Micromonospora wenchangensis TaxID=1185415 RepID=UPI0037F6F768
MIDAQFLGYVAVWTAGVQHQCHGLAPELLGYLLGGAMRFLLLGRLPSQEVSGLRGHFTDIGAFIGTLNTARVTSPLRCTSYGHAGDTLVRLTQTCPVLLAWAPDESLTAGASSPSGSTAVTMQW